LKAAPFNSDVVEGPAVPPLTSSERVPPGLQSSALKVAGHFVVPVNECAVWIVLPCPHVQFVKGVQAVSVWAGNQLQQLLIELRRSRILLCPGGCVHNELDANQA